MDLVPTDYPRSVGRVAYSRLVRNDEDIALPHRADPSPPSPEVLHSVPLRYGVRLEPFK